MQLMILFHIFQHEETPLHLVAKYDHAHLVPVFAAAKADLDLKAKVHFTYTNYDWW